MAVTRNRAELVVSVPTTLTDSGESAAQANPNNPDLNPPPEPDPSRDPRGSL